MEGTRLWLDLSPFFDCFRKQSCIYIDHSKEESVADVEKHVCQVMGLNNQKLCFLHDGWLLPASESSRVFRNDDIVSVVPFQDPILANAKNSPSDDSCVLVKIKKRKYEENGKHENNPAEVSQARHNGIQKNNLKIGGKTSILIEKETLESSSSCESDGESSTICSDHLKTKMRETIPLTSVNGTDNNSSENVKKRKRKRVRKRKVANPCTEPVNVKKESPYMLNKKLQGVSHFMSSFSSEKKHVFFTDDSDGTSQLPVLNSGIQTHSEMKCGSPTSSFNSISTGCIRSSVGELSKLMSLVDKNHTPVFERKKIVTQCNALNVNENVTDESIQPVFIKEIPEKDSVIKFKVLKMVNYCPEVSKNITARVLSTDLSTSQLHLFVIDGLDEMQPENGKFSLEDEAEVANNDPCVFLNWNEIIEPQKINI